MVVLVSHQPIAAVPQVWLPLRASRMIIATGGVWEAFDTFQKAVDALRDVSLPNAAAALLRRSLQHKQHLHNRGDMSVLVVDFVPEWCTEFRSQVTSGGAGHFSLSQHVLSM